MLLQFSVSRLRCLGAFFSAILCGGLSAHPEEFDIVVYGATSGGVTAAVQGARMGKKVALVSPTARIGGLSSAGLGWTDLGDIKILGGLSRDFYHRVYLHYSGQKETWETVRKMNGQGGTKVGDYGTAFNPTNQTGSIFEPKVAEQIFRDMLAESQVPIFTARLDLDDGVARTGQRITGIKMEDGRVFRGKMFIDASYEGDVMALAGVSFTIGREANETYGETISGVRSSTQHHQVPAGVSAYVTAGVPASGLLPGIESTPLEPHGSADHRLQAYCFRMVLTKNADNIPIAQPPGYDPLDFEIVLRAAEAGQTTFFKLDRMPNGKTDSNNSGGVSCDYIGRNYGPGWNWATLDHDQRDALAKEHEYWQRGLVWTLQNHPRVPSGVRATYAGWGLPRDEFQENGNWPYQIYVREARRMVSDYVMTQKNCNRTLVAEDSVGMGAYTMDSHNVRRHLVNGQIRNEGDVQTPIPGAYPISYRSIVPKIGECENLFVPWCLSASHMAFGSIRMEPVFMALGQSSATAAAIAIDDQLAVQEVPYDKLSMKLRADGQSLTLSASLPENTGTIVDNSAATLIGEWTSSTSISGFIGSDYLSDNNVDQGKKSVRFTPDLASSGSYEVFIRWTANPNRATNVPVKIFHKNGVSTATLNQQARGGEWVSLGIFPFNAGTSGNLLLETTGANGYVVADAARWVSPQPIVGVTTYFHSVVRGAPPGGEFVFTRNGSTTSPVTIYFTADGTAGTAEYSRDIPNSITLSAGASEGKITWIAPAASQPLGEKSLTLTLAPDPAYLIGSLSSATVTLMDDPFQSWRFNRFNSAELTDPAISGATADPDRNGASNLMEFFTGGAASPSILAQDDRLYLKFRRNPAAAGLKMKVWESGNLIDWSPSPELKSPTLFEKSGGAQEIGLPIRDGNPTGEGKRFFQLRIEN